MRADNETIGYFTKLAAEKLNVTKSRLRHLTMALEKNGYRFTRNKSNQRIFFQEDMETISQLLDKVKSGFTIDEASKTICRKTDLDHLPASTEYGVVISGNEVSIATEQLRSMVEQVAASAAQQAADQVAQRFTTEFERRIELRDKQLMVHLREVTEAKKRRKGIVFRLFGAK
ncbi:hypothetical protein ACFP7A_09750 [Sporolactobacillus kofuensis]|uniref:HTH merR-type domain-containing protein n=1 Tax=Sporolactobacillus kofuensis TaxID=269672 RepID=A0ABW1WII8_9BACL|nr:hypothetical protein [Sporolactobacillus kofuensis]MCO7176159.1 hypothetical protein [Sporolactobacillus kofuensis]